MSLLARDVMQREVVSVSPDTSLEELEEVFLRHRIGGAPVLEDGRVVGIVSRSDVVRQLQVERGRIAGSADALEPFDADERTEEDRDRVSDALGARLQDLHVRDAMIKSVVAVAPDASLREVAERMLSGRVHRLLVVEDARLCGVITSLDLVGLVAKGRLACV